MTRALRPPDVMAEIGKLRAELYELRRRLGLQVTSGDDTPIGTPEAVFTKAGALATGTSPRYTPRQDCSAVSAYGRLGTAGTSTTTVEVQRNGTTIGTLSFLSGNLEAEVTLSGTLSFGPSAATPKPYLTTNISAAGTAAADLVVQVEFR